MSRLKHSVSGFLRSMQMSQATLFVFVEGYKDRYAYSKIVDSEFQGCVINYSIVTGEELQGHGGGKNVLLSFFDYLKRRSSLIDRFKGKTTVTILFLDKDIDDFLRTKRRSKHVVYTETYELENYFFIYGDLSEAAAASSLLDISSIRNGLGDHAVWRQCAAANWKEWVKLCVFSVTRCIRPMAYYARHASKINDKIYVPVNKRKYREHISSLQKSSGLSSDQFKHSFKRSGQKIDKMYSNEQYDRIFKGKWYTSFLVEDIRRIAANRHYDSKGLAQRLLSNLEQTLNFDDNWAEQFRAPIRELVAELIK